MKVILKNTTIYDKNSPYHKKVKNIFIEDGKIISIGGGDMAADKKYTVIESKNLCVSPGWIDMQATFGDPGFEQKETIQSGLNTAASGGYTSVCLHSTTLPPIHNKTTVEYLLQQASKHITKLLPIGTITHQQKGENLSEMYDMKCAGAVAFSDYKHTIYNTHLLMRAMLYAQSINSLLIVHCQDNFLSAGGQMHEGKISAYLGLKGIPYISETIAIQQIIELLEYFPECKVHVAVISCKRSVELIKQAKNKGFNITCGTTTAHLYFNDEHLKTFDSNYKVNPPFRTEEDRIAIIKGVLNRTIDVLVSDHAPQDKENKDLEFDLAEFGIINLQTSYSAANTALGDEHTETLIEATTTSPYKILNINPPIVKEGEVANITVFDSTLPLNFTANTNLSLSDNSPFFGANLKGRVLGVVNNNQVLLNKFYIENTKVKL